MAKNLSKRRRGVAYISNGVISSVYKHEKSIIKAAAAKHGGSSGIKILGSGGGGVGGIINGGVSWHGVSVVWHNVYVAISINNEKA